MSGVTEEHVTGLARALPGVVVVTAGEADGAPQIAWGDSFFFYDPDDRPESRRHPFGTVVIKDYDGFDESSDLNRPGVFRLNLAVGRERFEQVLGHAPAEHSAHAACVGPAALDEIIPHPVYAAQGWISILCPGARTGAQARSLLEHARRRAAGRYRPRS